VYLPFIVGGGLIASVKYIGTSGRSVSLFFSLSLPAGPYYCTTCAKWKRWQCGSLRYRMEPCLHVIVWIEARFPVTVDSIRLAR